MLFDTLRLAGLVLVDNLRLAGSKKVEHNDDRVPVWAEI